MDPLSFRPATTTDIDEVVDLVQSAYRGDRSRQGWTTEADLIDGQRIDATMLRDLLAEERTIVLLAETERLIGCCELSCRHDPAVAYFGMFAVRPDTQGNGIGDSLLAEAERTAVELWNVSSMEMVILHPRAELIAWYERRGYAATGRTIDFPYGDERYGRPRHEDLRMVQYAKSLDLRHAAAHTEENPGP